MSLAEPEQRIDDRVDQGGSLAEVEEEIIEPGPFGIEQKAVLWLYASATIPRNLAEVTAGAAHESRSRLGGISTTLRSAWGGAVGITRRKGQRGTGRITMAERNQVDLQREVDEERPSTTESASDSERLERFKQGELDRRGDEVDGDTEVADFYVERR